jgi:pimeloyl-ACP methyl ester carboxylesterase
MTVREMSVSANGLEFAALEQGDGPLVLLLHGFPDNARTWEHQLHALADDGFRVVAPFLRGYHPTQVPSDARYDAQALGDDVAGLIGALGHDTARVVGVDWGALATAAAMALHPERIESGVMMSFPHPVLLLSTFNLPEQLHRAFHVWFFQLPGIAESVTTANDFALVDYLWQLWCPGYEDPDHLADVKKTLGTPGTMEAALGYYRALIAAADGSGPPEVLSEIKVPTLSVWGGLDPVIALAEGEAALFPNGYRREIIAGAGHFPQREQPQLMTEVLKDWLSS